MADRVNVFLSSTAYDLTDYRRAAGEAIIEAGMYPVYLEAVATTGNIVDVFVDLLKQAEIVVGIYAHWYGNFLPGESISWVEFEANYAVEHKKHYLPFMIDKNYPWNPDFYENRHPHAELLQTFQQRIWQNHRVQRFTDPANLKATLVQTLLRKPFSEIGLNRVVAEPLWGQPDPKSSQYKADIFMVMPFRPQQNYIYQNCIQKVAADLNLTIKRGDDFFTATAIMDNIWAAIYHANLVIADCTDRNTNVFYELGIAHTLGKPTLIISQKTDDIPFDLRHLRYILYDPEDLGKLATDLHNALNHIRS